MTRRSFGSLALLEAVLLLGCGNGSPTPPDVPEGNDVRVVRSGTSFGFCPSTVYCDSQVEITVDRAVFTKTSRAFGDVTTMRTLSEAEWRDLVAAVDEGRLRALPDVIGCPDCVDGGREFVEVTTAAWTKRVTFEYRANVPTIEVLVQRVRAIRAGFGGP